MTEALKEPDRAFVADPDRLNKHLTEVFRPFFGDESREVLVHPAAFSFEPQGSRLLVVCYPNPEKFGGIHLPDQDGEASGMGVVLSVGPRAFYETSPHPGSSFWPERKDLLYRTVIFGQYSGKPLRMNFTRDSRFSAEILVLSDKDIWAVRFPELNADYEVPNDFFNPTEESPL